jgi:hypothetical protein
MTSLIRPDDAGGAAPDSVRLITLDPGHFHAALFQKEMLPGIARQVHVYAPFGPDLLLHLNRHLLPSLPPLPGLPSLALALPVIPLPIPSLPPLPSLPAVTPADQVVAALAVELPVGIPVAQKEPFQPPKAPRPG